MAEQSQERLEILKKIQEYEKAGRFNEDVEQDAPGKELLPDQIDYLRYGLIARWKARRSIEAARKIVNMLQKQHQIIFKGVEGKENLEGFKGGAIMTSNHFNVMDSFAIHWGYEEIFGKGRRFYRIISESNYTSYEGPFKFLMQNADTLPLSSNKETVHKLFNSIDTLLQDGHVILIYPEQSMWWNYRKPRPCQNGAYNFAVKSNVPVIPAFITMEDSEYTDGEGFPVQEYTIHYGKPIYPDPAKSRKENIQYMKEENQRIWKEIYEKAYGIPLTYTCDN